MNNLLKAKIIEKFGKQWLFARKIGIHESVLSKIISGCKPPSKDQKKMIAKGLRCNEKDIFPFERRLDHD